ncbi:unnamed protein product [Linum tenue]|uniref:Reticulon-like protein n=1 Tax=Linum tenue TaxID=586396 RepID=A0AAV0RME9_9ROSI|nr:unnamed protein product [Linum tenue]
MGETAAPPPSGRISVHQLLGGGSVADVLLWRRWGVSLTLLVVSSTSWYLFERAGYNLLTFVANVLFLLVLILFLWAKSASLLNRPLPPIPDLEITEETVDRVSQVVQVYVNHVLAVGCDIAIGRNLKVFLQISFVSWIVSYVGSLCSFLTFAYAGILLSLSIPVVYDKFQHQIDEKLVVAQRILEAQQRKIDETLLKKLPRPSQKEKKVLEVVNAVAGSYVLGNVFVLASAKDKAIRNPVEEDLDKRQSIQQQEKSFQLQEGSEADRLVIFLFSLQLPRALHAASVAFTLYHHNGRNLVLPPTQNIPCAAA